MTLSFAASDRIPSPFTAQWTIAAVLEWIGADDERCHDERLFEILDAVDQALAGGSVAGARTVSRVVVRSARVVMLVRSVASRVVADPAQGARRLGEVWGGGESAAVARGVLVTV
jgi:hypothetical protein